MFKKVKFVFSVASTQTTIKFEWDLQGMQMYLKAFWSKAWTCLPHKKEGMSMSSTGYEKAGGGIKMLPFHPFDLKVD